LCITLFSWLSGVVGDVFGRRRLLIAAMLIYAALGVAPFFLDSLVAILATRAAVGICESIVMTLTTVMIGDYFKGALRDRWLASQTAVASLSALLFFNIRGYLGTFGWRYPFLIYLSSLPMILLILKYTWEPRREDEVAAATRKIGWAEFPFVWMA